MTVTSLRAKYYMEEKEEEEKDDDAADDDDTLRGPSNINCPMS